MIVNSIYIFLFISTLFTLLDLTNLDKKKKKYLFGCLCIFATIIVGFRSGVGFDYWGYVDIFNGTPPITEWYTRWQELYSGRLTFIELGYLAVNGIVAFISGDVLLVFLFMAALSFFLYYQSIPKMTKYIFSAFFIYLATVFFYKEMGQIRHGTAMALSLYSLYYLVNNKNKKFIICNIIAVLFHKAVLPIFILLFLKKIKWNRLIALIVLTVSIGLYIIDISEILVTYIGGISIFADQTASVLQEDNIEGLVSLERFIFPVLVALFSIIFMKQMEKSNSYFHIELTMLLIGIGILATFHGFKEFGQRLSAVMLLSEILIFPQICIGLPRSLLGKFVGIFIILAFCTLYILHTLEVFPMYYY